MLNFEQEDISIPVKRFEKMIKTNQVLFFDAQEFEGIIQYYIDSGKLNLADRALEIGMNQHPNNGELILLKSEILIFEGDFKQSLELLDLAEKLYPQHEEIFIQKATIASKTKKHDEAIHFLKVALNYSNDSTEILNLIGMEFMLIKKFSAAKYYFKLCLKRDPFDYQALYNLLHIFEQLSQENESINFLGSILDKNPYCEVAWHQLGKIHYKKGNFREAISAFDFAIISDDSFTGAYIEKGKILEKIGNLNTAIENYHIATEINDPSAYVYHRIACCHKILGNKDLSLSYFKKTILIEPNFEKGWIEIIDFYYQNSDFKNALHYSKKAIESNGDNPFFSYKAGQLIMKNGNYSSAIFYFENSIDLGNSEIGVWTDLLDCLIKLYRLNQAKNIVYKALAIFKNSPLIIFRLGVIQVKLGNSVVATKYLNSIDQKVLNKLLKNELYSDLASII
ncbi:MAG: hypothetical protein CMC81_04840 [Flavobacteriaceae bacterium]|nr:hypothetical protein [Flavobacteriaceae bacterium]